MTGTIIHYDQKKYYGFIRCPEKTREARDAFFHITAFRDYKRDRPPIVVIGAAVTFTLVQTEKGMAAEAIEIVESGA